MTATRGFPSRYVALGVLATIGAAVVVALLPVRIQQTTTNASPDLQQASAFEDTRAWEPAELRVEIVSAHTGPVTFDLPVRPYGGPVPAGWLESDGWEPTPDGARLIASEPGSSLRIEGLFSYLQLHVRSDTQPAPITVSINGEATQVDANGDGAGFSTLLAATGRPITHSGQRLVSGGVEAQVAPGACVTYEAFVARIRVETGDHCADVDGGDIRVGLPTLLGGLFGSGVAVLPIALTLIGFFAWSGLVGHALLARLGSRSALFGATTVSLGVAVGFGVIGALNYLLPVRAIALAVILVMGGLAAVELRSRRPDRLVEGSALTSMLLSAGGVIVLFALSNRTGAGLLQTDIYEYQRLTQLFWSEGALASDSDFGSGLRLLDSSARSVFYGLANLSPTDVVLLMHALAVSLVAGAVTALIRSTRGAVRAVSAGLIAAFGAALVGLFVEGYMSRVFMACFMIVGWCLAAAAIDQRGNRVPLLVSAGASFGVAAAIVPMYLVPALAVAWVLVSEPSQVARPWRDRLLPLLPGAISLAAVSLPNLFWIRRPDVASRYAEGVEEIGREIVLPFHDRPTILNTMAGVEPTHANPLSLLGRPPGSTLPSPYESVLDTVSDHALLAACVVAIGVLLLVFAPSREEGTSETDRLVRWTWILTGLGFALILPTWSTQSYFILMYVWTLAPLLYVTLVFRTMRERVSSRSVIPLAGYALIVMNVVSAGAEFSMWYGPERSKFDERWRFDTGATVLDVDEWAASAVPGTYRLDTRPSDVFQTDDGRVIANLVDQLLIDRGFECVDCVRQQPTRSLELDDPSTPDTTSGVSDYIVVVGSHTCDGTVALRTDYAAVCETPASIIGE